MNWETDEMKSWLARSAALRRIKAHFERDERAELRAEVKEQVAGLSEADEETFLRFARKWMRALRREEKSLRPRREPQKIDRAQRARILELLGLEESAT